MKTPSKKFAYLLALAALLLAGTAAFFSVTGLSKLFSGAATAVMVMAGSLEFAKLVVASFLYRYWKDIKTAMKVYMTIAVTVLIFITSAGVYGYLSNAYSSTAGKVQQSIGQITILEKKKEMVEKNIEREKELIENKNKRINTLVQLRNSQENRLDSLYKKGWRTSAKQTEKIIKDANDDINKLSKEVDDVNNKIEKDSQVIQDLETKILEAQNNDSNSEAGPLKYIANLTGKDMNSVANFFMLLLVFVFDPLAVLLTISFSVVLRKIDSDNNNEQKKEQEIPSTKKNESEIINEEQLQETQKEEKSNKESFQTFLKNKKSKIDEDKINYIDLLKMFFKNGLIKKGQELPSYNEFMSMIDAKQYSQEVVKTFLTLVNYLEISKVNRDVRVALKSYEDSKKILEDYFSFENKK